jgi:hypothetical protein
MKSKEQHHTFAQLFELIVMLNQLDRQRVAVALIGISFLVGNLNQDSSNAYASNHQLAEQTGKPHPDQETPLQTDFFAIGFELGVTKNPHLLWQLQTDLQNSSEATSITADVFDALFQLETTANGNSTIVLGPIFEQFAITQEQVIELMEGYVLGLLNPTGDLETLRSSLDFTVSRTWEDFRQFCTEIARACYTPGVMHFTSDYDPDVAPNSSSLAAGPHETMHHAILQDLFFLPAELDTTFELNGITIQLTHANEANPGLVMSTPEGELGIFDWKQIHEAAAEVFAQIIFTTMGKQETNYFYASLISEFSNPELYLQFINHLATNDEQRNQLLVAFLNPDRVLGLKTVFELTGEILLANNPNYLTEVYNFLETQPDRQSDSYFYFNLARYQTADLAQRLPANFQAGLFFWTEAAALARTSTTDHGLYYQGEELTLVVSIQPDGQLHVINRSVNDIIKDRLGAPEGIMKDRYEWGDAIQEIGYDQAVRLATEFQTTGQITHPETISPQLAIAAVLEVLLAPNQSVQLTDQQRFLFTETINNLTISFVDTKVSEGVPFSTNRIETVQQYAGINEFELTVETTVETTSTDWARDTLWAVFTAYLENRLSASSYPWTVYLGTDASMTELHQQNQGQLFTFIQRSWLPSSESTGHVEIIDVSDSPKLLALMISQALQTETDPRLATLFPPNILRVIDQMRVDRALLTTGLVSSPESNIYPFLFMFSYGQQLPALPTNGTPNEYASNHQWLLLEAALMNLQSLQIPGLRFPLVFKNDQWSIAPTDFAELNEKIGNTNPYGDFPLAFEFPGLLQSWGADPNLLQNYIDEQLLID